MVLRLNLIINYFISLLIKFYQRFISKRIDRTCIYPISCSNYALETLKKSSNIFRSIYIIYKRYTGCKVLDIVCENSCKWHIINANGDIIKTNQLHCNTIEDINRTIDIYKVSNNLKK
jgi:putative component of membrane protein insertase Oxa1/YidC/SpoIIIJ protein YidD